VDHLFAQCLACFEAMQTVYEDEAITIAPHQDGSLLSDFQNTLRDLLDGLWFERCAALYRHVDVRDRKFFPPHHGTSPKCANEKSCHLGRCGHWPTRLPLSTGSTLPCRRCMLHHGKLGSPMSALGQKRTLQSMEPMSALPPKADMIGQVLDV